MMLRRNDRNLENIPVGALGLIALDGCTEMGAKVNDYLVKWRKEDGTIYRLEAGKNFIKSETLAKLCDALDVHPSLFFTARPTITLDNHADSIKNITRLLQTFSQDKLNDAYNILKVLHK